MWNWLKSRALETPLWFSAANAVLCFIALLLAGVCELQGSFREGAGFPWLLLGANGQMKMQRQFTTVMVKVFIGDTNKIPRGKQSEPLREALALCSPMDFVHSVRKSSAD